MLIASFLYSGYSDYFSGYDCIDNDEYSEYLLYAYYGRSTTLRDIIDQLIDDSWMGPTSEELPEEIITNDVRVALLAMLSDEGRADYESGAIAECSADMNRVTECPKCDVKLPDRDWDKCPNCGEWFDQGESSIFIVLLHYEKEE